MDATPPHIAEQLRLGDRVGALSGRVESGRMPEAPDTRLRRDPKFATILRWTGMFGVSDQEMVNTCGRSGSGP